MAKARKPTEAQLAALMEARSDGEREGIIAGLCEAAKHCEEHGWPRGRDSLLAECQRRYGSKLGGEHDRVRVHVERCGLTMPAEVKS